MDLTYVTLATAIIVLLLYIYQYVKRCHSHWEEIGIPYEKPNFFFGNLYNVLKGQPISMFYKDLYEKFSQYGLAGYYTLLKPYLLIRDPEIIKLVLTKDFNHFQNRGIKSHPKIEPLSNNLVILEGNEWKNLRIKLTPSFTSGKIKLMFPFIKECAEEMVKVLQDKAGVDVEFKDIAARYTTDVIGTCAFGLEPHSLVNPDSEFRRIGKKIFSPRLGPVLRIIIPSIPPFLIQLLKLKFVEDEVHDFFASIVKETVENREKTGTSRNDFLDLLIKMKNSSEQIEDKEADAEINNLSELNLQSKDSRKKTFVDMTVELMTAQCFIFFGAGFETSSTAISSLLFELAQNKQVQLKLQEEVDKVMSSCDGNLMYYDVVEMRYLDMVLAETLRKYPPSAGIHRTCTEVYKIPGTETVIKKGEDILIPVIGLHHDPKYFENPDMFNPENFNEEAKAARPSCSYLPFGDGPRSCIAGRFAKVVVKVAVAYLIRNYEFELSQKMELPVKYEANFGFVIIKGGVWLRMKKRILKENAIKKEGKTP